MADSPIQQRLRELDGYADEVALRREAAGVIDLYEEALREIDGIPRGTHPGLYRAQKIARAVLGRVAGNEQGKAGAE